MTDSTRSKPLRVLIVGGGVAALEALLALRHLAEERVSIELVTAEPQFWYRPLAVAEPFDVGRVHGLDVSTVADECGAGLTLGAVESVDVERHRLRTVLGAELEYDVLLIAIGARPVPAVPGALSFRGPADTDAFSALLAELETGAARSVAFAVPGGVAWPLPLYELALQTAGRLARRDADAHIVLVTHEESPLNLFGPVASGAVSDVLVARGIEVWVRAYPVAFADGTLRLTPNGSVDVDRVVALPRLEGVPVDGIPHDPHGFIPTGDDGRVRGLPDVFAAGDATTFPVKQGGLAAQQADAAAETIAALAGADVQPRGFRPVLRGLILTGGPALFARTELAGVDEPAVSETEPLWWPPGKIVGRYLAPFLAERSGAIVAPPPDEAGVVVDVELTQRGGRTNLSPHRHRKDPPMSARDERTEPAALPAAHPFDIAGAKERLAAGMGGYEVVHRSRGLEIGVYVLVAPEPDRQQPHEDDEVYVLLEGSGVLEIEGENVELREGHAIFVPAGAEHRFVGYEHLSVLVIFEKRQVS